MAQTKHEIQAILAGAGSEPRHRFGQNFMIDQNLVRLVAEAGEVHPRDLVIEVGPGTGTLTEELLSRGADVVAVEIDRDLAGALRERWGGGREKSGGEATEPPPHPSPGVPGEGAKAGTFRLIEGDALAGKHALNEELLTVLRSAEGRPRKLVANLPYNIASPLVIELLIEGVELLAFTVQKEVADRLRATAGTDAYGPLTVMAQLLAKVEVLRTLPPQAFWPAPKIDSALVRLRRADRLGDRVAAVGTFVRELFSARRKTLRKALSQMDRPTDEATFATLGLDPKARPETLSPEQVLALFTATGGA